MTQLALPLDWPADERDADLVSGNANRDAIRHLDRWALWPVPVTLLTGPRKSGRSRLGRLFAAKTEGRLIDDAWAADEETLFHAWNAAVATRRPLLIVADDAPPGWRVALPDLASRLAATPRAAIGEPDDRMVRALIERGLARRGLAAPPRLLDWLGRRIERSHLGAALAVDAIERAALRSGRRLSPALARDALAVADLSFPLNREAAIVPT